MPIRVGHDINPALTAQLSFKAGQGKYEQWKDTFEAQQQQQAIDNAFRMSGELRNINQPYVQAQLQQWGNQQRANLEIEKTKELRRWTTSPEYIAETTNAELEAKRQMWEGAKELGVQLKGDLQANLAEGEVVQWQDGTTITGTNPDGKLRGGDAIAARDRIYGQLNSITSGAAPKPAPAIKSVPLGNGYFQPFINGQPSGPPQKTTETLNNEKAESLAAQDFVKRSAAHAAGVQKQIEKAHDSIDKLVESGGLSYEDGRKRKGDAVSDVTKHNPAPTFAESLSMARRAFGLSAPSGGEEFQMPVGHEPPPEAAPETGEKSPSPWRPSTYETKRATTQGLSPSAVGSAAETVQAVVGRSIGQVEAEGEGGEDGDITPVVQVLKEQESAAGLLKQLAKAQEDYKWPEGSPGHEVLRRMVAHVEKWQKQITPVQEAIDSGEMTPEWAEKIAANAGGNRGQIAQLRSVLLPLKGHAMTVINTIPEKDQPKMREFFGHVFGEAARRGRMQGFKETARRVVGLDEVDLTPLLKIAGLREPRVQDPRTGAVHGEVPQKDWTEEVGFMEGLSRRIGHMGNIGMPGPLGRWMGDRDQEAIKAQLADKKSFFSRGRYPRTDLLDQVAQGVGDIVDANLDNLRHFGLLD